MSAKIGFKVDTNALARAEASIGGLKTSIISVGAVVGVFAAGVVGLLKVAGAAEQTRIAFETMIGDADKAKAALDSLSLFAARTPFTIPQVERTAKQLLAARVTLEELEPTLKALGDVAAGVSVPLDQVTKNFAQIKSQGKLTGRELRDFLLAGIPLIQELGKNLKKSDSQISAMVSTGDIGFREVEKAFQTMSGEGGLFFDLMDKQSKSLFGVLSNLKDTLIILARVLGSTMLPEAKQYVTAFRKWVIVNDKFIKQNLVKLFKTLAKWIGHVVSFVSNLFIAFKGLTRIVGGLNNALKIMLGIMLGLLIFSSIAGIGMAFQRAAMGVRVMIAAVKSLYFWLGLFVVILGLIIEDWVVFQRGTGKSLFGALAKMRGKGGLMGALASITIVGMQGLTDAVTRLADFINSLFNKKDDSGFFTKLGKFLGVEKVGDGGSFFPGIEQVGPRDGPGFLERLGNLLGIQKTGNVDFLTGTVTSPGSGQTIIFSPITTINGSGLDANQSLSIITTTNKQFLDDFLGRSRLQSSMEPK